MYLWLNLVYFSRIVKNLRCSTRNFHFGDSFSSSVMLRSVFALTTTLAFSSSYSSVGISDFS